ncbi:MAG: Smr domain protein [Bacilli bacterium]
MAKKVLKEVQINLHGLYEFEARAKLNEILGNLPNDIEKVRIIHGYHGGQILQTMVRKEYNHPRIDDIMPVFANDGETVYIIKKKYQ